MKYLFSILLILSLNANALDQKQAAQLLADTKASLKKEKYDHEIINDLKTIVLNKDGLPVQVRGDNFVCSYIVVCEKNPYDIKSLPTYYTYDKKKDVLCVMFAPGETMFSVRSCMLR